MIHTAKHDPIIDYRQCNVCYESLVIAWVKLTGMAADNIEEKIMMLRRILSEDAA